jgi:uncharacterized phage protein (TIGR02218 family)
VTKEALLSHLETGSTTVCRAWTVARRDGQVLGFTDHDRDLVVNGVTCRADTGMTARALQQTTGLSVDNTEAFGALSASAIREDDLLAGRYDGAEVRAFLVNWASPQDSLEQFRGNLGEISRVGGSFKAELRGLTDLLNRPHGMAYTPGCSAILGDARCGFDLNQLGFSVERLVETVEDGRVFRFSTFATYDDFWFEGGRFEVVDGAAAGLIGVIKIDRRDGGGRRVELWQSVMAPVAEGDTVKIFAGCSKTATICRTKFNNFLNFRGFPHIPGEDWLASYPVPDRPSGGGSRFGGGGS